MIKYYPSLTLPFRWSSSGIPAQGPWMNIRRVREFFFFFWRWPTSEGSVIQQMWRTTVVSLLGWRWLGTFPQREEHGTSILSVNYRNFQGQLKELMEKKELGKGKWVQRERVWGLPHLPLFWTLFLAGISSLYSPCPHNYRFMVPLQFKSTECLPSIRLCSRCSHITSGNSCVEVRVHRAESVPPSVLVCLHHCFLSGPLSMCFISLFFLISIHISSPHWSHFL